MSKKPIIISSFLFFLLGFGLSFILFGPKMAKIDDGNTYQAGWEAAKKRLVEQGMIQMPDDDHVIDSFYGIVDRNERDSLIVSIKPILPLDDPALDSRTVRINNNTELLKIAEKDKAVYDEEYSAYLEKIRGLDFDPNSEDAPISPSRYAETEAVVGDFKANTKVKVEADGDIRDKQELTAKRIIIQPR